MLGCCSIGFPRRCGGGRSHSKALAFWLLLVLGAAVFYYVGRERKGIMLLPVYASTRSKVEGKLTTMNNTFASSSTGISYDNSTNNSNLQLPSLAKGGILLFVHIPKTGGTTIRELVKYHKKGRRSKVHYIYLHGPKEYQDTVTGMKEWLLNGVKPIYVSNQVVFIEYHALRRECPTFLHLSQTVLPLWRKVAHMNKVPLFAFSILREPVSMSISYFNYYHGIVQNVKRFDYLGETNVTEQVFVNYTHANPQCLFLARNEEAFTKTGKDLRDSLVQEDCRQAYEGLKSNMDWIGTTDRLRDETLPLLRELLSTNEHTQRLVHTLNKTANASGRDKKPPIEQSKLSEKTIQYLKGLNKWDQELYDSVKRDFSYDAWDVHANLDGKENG